MSPRATAARSPPTPRPGWTRWSRDEHEAHGEEDAVHELHPTGLAGHGDEGEPSKAYSSIHLPIGGPESRGAGGGEPGRRDIAYRWDITALSLVPEDVLGDYAEVFDNDDVSGPKSARTPSFLLRLPSLEEVLADVDRGSEESLTELQKMSEELQDLMESLDELNREAKKQRDRVDWQQQKKAEQLAQRYEQLRQKAEQSARQMEELVDKMDENNLLSDATLEKYREIQKLMEEMNSEELREALPRVRSTC